MHVPVMLRETIELLAIRSGGTYVDGTLGSGGHALAILEQAGSSGTLLGIDRDAEALQRAAHRLQDAAGRVILAHGGHGELGSIAAHHGLGEVDGVLLDLGVSSNQLDTPQRGFSFMHEGPLDMRMDQKGGESAAELLQRLSAGELAALFAELGEERFARRIAAAIKQEQERSAIVTTLHLAEVINRAVGGYRGKRHPATRVFQALRMRVNNELEQLEQALDDGLRLLRPGGRMAVISFESICDRMVKRCFVAHAGRNIALQQGGEQWEGVLPAVIRITKGVLKPGYDEVSSNPRARTARLRVVERCLESDN